MSNAQVNEFKKYLQDIAAGNAADTLGIGAFFNESQNAKQMVNIAAVLEVPRNEEIIILFDETAYKSGKEGLVLTSWGIRYKAYKLELDMSWEEMATKYNVLSSEKYSIAGKIIKFQNKDGDTIIDEKELRLVIAISDAELLIKILMTGRGIFAGNKPREEDQEEESENPNDYVFEWKDVYTIFTANEDSVAIRRVKYAGKTEYPWAEPVTIARSAISHIKIKRVFSPIPYLLFSIMGMGAVIGFVFFGGIYTFLAFTIVGLLTSFPKMMVIYRKDGAKYKTVMSGNKEKEEYERLINVLFK